MACLVLLIGLFFSSARASLQLIGAGRGDSGTTQLHKTLCAMGMRSQHEEDACNFPDNQKAFAATGLDALYGAFRRLRKHVIYQQGGDSRVSEALILRFEDLVRSYSATPPPWEPFSVHDSPVPYFMSSFSRANPEALVVHMIHSPSAVWVERRFASGHGDHDMICRESLIAKLEDPFDVVHCLRAHLEHNSTIRQAFMSTRDLMLAGPGLLAEAYERYTWAVRKLARPSRLMEVDLWQCAKNRNTSKCDVKTELEPRLRAFIDHDRELDLALL